MSSKQVVEDENGYMQSGEIRDNYRLDDDDHYAKTTLLCLENTHNMLGGVTLPASYIDQVGNLAHEELGIKVHIDGARLMNSVVKQNISPSDLIAGADSASICLSKALGAPMGSLLVGETEFIRLARRARKRLGGGMRQAGVMASMGMYALTNHVERLAEDHARAERIAAELHNAGFPMPRDGKVDTNILFFALPENSKVTKEELPKLLLDKYNVLIAGGYSKGGRLFRLVTHMDVDDDGVDAAINGIISLCL